MASPTNKAKPERREYRTAQSTIDAFWYLVDTPTYDDAYVRRWLNEHPRDKAYLLDLWRKKRARPA